MEILRCLLLPVQNQTLMLPYSAVAEIVILPDPNTYEGKLGKLSWRGKEIPLLDIDFKQGSHRPVPNAHMPIAILNKMSETSPDFIGIQLQGLPIMGRFKKNDLEAVTTPSLPAHPYLLMEIVVKKKPAVIPNMQKIAEAILKLSGSNAAQ